MRIYVLSGFDYDGDWIIRAYYLEEEAKAVVDEWNRFTRKVGDRCSINALEYELSRITGYPMYYDNGLSYKEVDLV